MDIKHNNCILYIFAMTFILILMSCTTASKSITHDIPQLNNVRIIEKNGFPDRDKKIWVILQAPELSPNDYNEWRTKHIPNAFKKAGLRNYKITDPKIQQLKSSDIGRDYLLVIRF